MSGGKQALKRRNLMIKRLLAGALVFSITQTQGAVGAANVMAASLDNAAEDGDEDTDAVPEEAEGEGSSAGEELSESASGSVTTSPESPESRPSESAAQSQAASGASSVSEDPAPTEEPEVTPTPTAAGEPTAEPTEEPGVTPTAEPTEEPSVSPTEEPTVSPTEEPTAAPTETPSATPTPSPAEKNSDDDDSSGNSGGRTSEVSGNYTLDSSNSFSGTVSTARSAVNEMIERRRTLLKDFKKIDKKYAIAATDNGVNIREGKGTDTRIVGYLPKGALCYIIADDEQEWIYVESGDVRGFVRSDIIEVGDKADDTVAKTGEVKMQLAVERVNAFDNTAYRYSLNTVRNVAQAINKNQSTSADRSAMIEFAQQFVGNPYVWGGESLTDGCDCSGFTEQVYAHFGITLPRCSYEQAEVGTEIRTKNLEAELKPGDLIYYARSLDGTDVTADTSREEKAGHVQVYHVMMYIGNGQVVHAQSSKTGIVVSAYDKNKVCWATRIIDDGAGNASYIASTQAASLVETGRKAYEGDAAAQQSIIDTLAQAAGKEWLNYGFCRSVLVAQVIEESGWCSFSGAARGGILPEDNNILGMNAELNNSTWTSPWTGGTASRLVPQSVNGLTVYNYESMRTYEDIESCLEDYAAFKIGVHPDLRGVTDIDRVISEGLKGYATNPNYQSTIKSIISKYNLTALDSQEVAALDGRTLVNSEIEVGDKSEAEYSASDLALISAIISEFDGDTYEGALSAITAAMNRAEENYNGYGTTVLDQLTKSPDFGYSDSEASTEEFRKLLKDGVSEDVQKAVDDCLKQGYRNHTFTNVMEKNQNGTLKLLGHHWYY